MAEKVASEKVAVDWSVGEISAKSFIFFAIAFVGLSCRRGMILAVR